MWQSDYTRMKRGNVLTLAVFTMALSGIFSAVFVLSDGSRPDGYAMLWLLPVFFTLCCSLIYPMRHCLFTRISITLIVGFYWIRMVLSPIVMVLGRYSVVPKNRSWEIYLDQAILLECYESLIVFLVLLGLSRFLKKPPQPRVQLSTEKMTYSGPFYMVAGCFVLFFLGMIALYPDLIRYRFVTIFGAPDGWSIALEQRSLDGSGSGPLGILVTQWCNLIPVMQILLPVLVLTAILNRRKQWGSTRILVASFALIGVVCLIATESRANSVIIAMALLITLISYSTPKQRWVEGMVLAIFALLAVCALWYKTLTQSRIGAEVETMERLSMMVSAYFPGPQNQAAAIEASKRLLGPDPTLLFTDLAHAIPNAMSILTHLIGPIGMSTNSLFNYSLYSPDEFVSTDQNLPAIGQGLILFGFLLAPIIPVVTVTMCVGFEKLALRAKKALWRCIWYTATIFLSFCQVSNNLGVATLFLSTVLYAALIAAPDYFRCKRGSFRLEKVDASNNPPAT